MWRLCLSLLEEEILIAPKPTFDGELEPSSEVQWPRTIVIPEEEPGLGQEI